MSTLKHSVKVPRLYKDASRILKSVHDGESLKYLVFNHNKFSNIKALHALVAEAVKYDKLLTRILELTNIFDLENRFDPWLAKVLLTELIFGKKQLPGNSKPILTILKYKDDIEKHLKTADIYNVSSWAKQNKKAVKPKYVRVNTLKISLEDVINIFKSEGWEELQCPSTYDEYLQLIKERMFNEEYVFVQDYHIKNLLVFPSAVSFFDHTLYLEQHIILQDKASCLLTCCVPLKPGSVILDMCAAPGMKTALLAACINNQGKIYAVELDPRRYNTMLNLLVKYGVDCVRADNCDGGSVGPNTCEDVKYILVDPSCSGTGMTSRVEDVELDVNSAASYKFRLQKLSNVQGYLLRHAVSNFPSVKYVIYSTCSIREEENEMVVESVLGCAKFHGYSLVNLRKKISGWKNFGSDNNYECGRKCIYTRSESDFTNGGFLAVFKRKSKNVIPAAIKSEKESIEDENSSKKKRLKLSEQFFALVNTLKISVEDAIQLFVDNGWKHLPSPMNYNIFLSGLGEDTKRVEEKFFEQDFHVKELLIFPMGIVDALAETFTKERKFILLDKVSCLAVHLLDPTPGSKVIDICAGQEKMSLGIASRMNNIGTVVAYESNSILNGNLLVELDRCGITCVNVVQDSGLYSSSSDCPGVKLVLVCPPCSGSGSGLLQKTQYSLIKNTNKRNKGDVLRHYVVTQFALLRHAFTKFPEAHRIVYVTRSIYPEENEDIINALLVLAKFNGFLLIDAPGRVEGWNNECSTKYFWSKNCLITRDETSITKGFFVAVFERILRNKTVSAPRDSVPNDNSVFEEENKEDNNSYTLHNVDLDSKNVISTGGNNESNFGLCETNRNSKSCDKIKGSGLCKSDKNFINESRPVKNENLNVEHCQGASSEFLDKNDLNGSHKKSKKHKRKNISKETCDGDLLKETDQALMDDLRSTAKNIEDVKSCNNKKHNKSKKTSGYFDSELSFKDSQDCVSDKKSQVCKPFGDEEVRSVSKKHKRKNKENLICSDLLVTETPQESFGAHLTSVFEDQSSKSHIEKKHKKRKRCHEDFDAADVPSVLENCKTDEFVNKKKLDVSEPDEDIDLRSVRKKHKSKKGDWKALDLEDIFSTKHKKAKKLKKNDGESGEINKNDNIAIEINEVFKSVQNDTEVNFPQKYKKKKKKN